MAKYIIDVPDTTQWIQWMNISEKDGSACFDYKAPEDLTPYVRSESYIDGLKKGQNDAWEFVMKCLKMDGNDFYEIFNSCDALCLTNLSYQEAKAKYESWKKFKDEIRIGDEIKIKTSYSADAVVIGMDDYDLFIVWKDGETDRIEPPERKQWVKTGRHFKEVEELLKKITEESNED